MRLLICGSTGLLGRALAHRLAERGDEVWTLDRRPASARGLSWPATSAELAEILPEGLEAVVNLAGSPILRWPWTRRALAVIRESRVGRTRQLAGALASSAGRSGGRPRLLCASAVGIYRTGWPAVDEQGGQADSLLGNICRDWEAAAEEARAAGLSVAHLRTGLVLDPAGGLLAKLLPVWRLGLGGRLGPADLPWSWIHREDWLAAVVHLLDQAREGPFNLCAPRPVTQEEALGLLGRALGRRGLLPVPAALIALLGGRMARELLLQAPAALPARLLADGYRFRHPELEPALADLLGE